MLKKLFLRIAQTMSTVYKEQNNKFEKTKMFTEQRLTADFRKQKSEDLQQTA